MIQPTLFESSVPAKEKPKTGPGNYVTLSKIETKDQIIVYSKKRLIEDTKLWTMQFYGGCSTKVLGAGKMSISPKEQSYPVACCLQLEFTEAGKEVFLLGLKNVKDMGIKLLFVKGDIELIDELVKGYF